MLLLAMSVALFAESPTSKGTIKDVAVSADGKWVDTGVDAGVRARLKISATGSIQYDGAPQAAGPDGLARGWKDLLRILPLNSAGRGALIGRFGKEDFSQPFAIGADREIPSGAGGRLYLSVNQSSADTGVGNFSVRIEVLDAGQSAAQTTPFDQLPLTQTFSGINAGTLTRIPRRVSDSQGNAGDMVNFLVLGSEQNLRKAFEAAGWVEVDRTNRDAFVHGLIATLSKESYVEVPMSVLYLFGRPQDYGLAHAVPFAVVAERHHLRIWKAPFDVDGQTLWVGAATHDVGFDKDNRNGGITHKIDPDVDQERKFVGESLDATGLLARMAFLMPADALRDARTATGGSFHSDGRILAILLAP